MAKKKPFNTSPQVVKGVQQPSLLNEKAAQAMMKRKRQRFSIQYYVNGILGGNRVTLGQAITIIESTNTKDQALGQAIINACLPYAGKSIRLGITGSPGVGKSTFIENFGQHLIQQERKVAALAIDPSSQISKGSILGDKTRMEKLSSTENAFIRPSPAGDSLGGVARKTRESIILCEAAGFDTIIIETVGVGQSEIAMHSMVDVFLLLIAPGGGDELQGIKRGIVEMADLVIVNKADGERQSLVKRTARDYKNALHLYPPKQSQWQPKVATCSALQGEGITKIWESIQSYFLFTKENQYFDQNRNAQSKYWLYETIESHLKKQFYNNPDIQTKLKEIEQAVLAGKLTPFQGAEKLF